MIERACEFNLSRAELTQCVTVSEIKNAKLKACADLGLNPEEVTMNGCPDVGQMMRENVMNQIFANLGTNLQDLVHQVEKQLKPFLGSCKQM